MARKALELSWSGWPLENLARAGVVDAADEAEAGARIQRTKLLSY